MFDSSDESLSPTQSHVYTRMLCKQMVCNACFTTSDPIHESIRIECVFIHKASRQVAYGSLEALIAHMVARRLQ